MTSRRAILEIRTVSLHSWKLIKITPRKWQENEQVTGPWSMRFLLTFGDLNRYLEVDKIEKEPSQL